MTAEVYNAIALVLIVGVLAGIRFMRSPRTAVAGNLLGATCMLAAIVLTLLHHGIVSTGICWGAMAAGAVGGGLLAIRVAMVQMPQLVATLNGLGGGASATVAMVILLGGLENLNLINRISCGLALAVGTVTLSGSLVAAGKLAGWVNQRPVVLRGHMWLNGALMAATVAFGVAVSGVSGNLLVAVSAGCLVTGALTGLVMTLRIGGADMPITISLLNSLSGVAAAIAGFAVGNPLLVGVGGIVGAAGLILTHSMCRAMNRSLVEVLSGRTTTAGPVTEPAAEPDVGRPGEGAAEHAEADIGAILRAAKTAIIVPGYGMALAQAQSQVKTLMDSFEACGCEVNFAVHPVAGRMPGHMNVLLAEVDVPYEKLWELETANEAFPGTDVVIVIGANDVVNPAAMTAEGTPIYGMPVLKVRESRQVIICNRDRKPGYAGVDNPLYRDAGVVLLEGDAKETVARLTAALETWEQPPPALFC